MKKLVDHILTNFSSGWLFRILTFAVFCSVLFFQTGYSQTRKIDSLKTLAKKHRVDTNKINAINELGWELMEINPDTSIILSKQGLALALKIKWKKGKAKALGNLGVCHYLKGEYPMALSYFLKALKIEMVVNNKRDIARRLGNIGVVYMEQADYAKALKYHFRALKIQEEIQDKSGIARTLGNIGIVYSHQVNYSKTLDYYFRAMKMDKELGNKTGVIRHLGNIGIIYNFQGDYLKALEYYFMALKMDEEIGTNSSNASTYGNIGNVYRTMGDSAFVNGNVSQAINELYPKALEYYTRSLKTHEELGYKHGIAIQLGNIGSLHTQTKNFAAGEKYLKDALRIDKEIGALNGIRHIEEALSTLYEKTNRFQLALEYHKKASAIKDSLFNEQQNKELTRKELNYEFEKKEAVSNAEHKKEIEKQNAIAEEKNRKQKIITISVFGGLLLVLVFAAFILRSLRLTRKQKIIIEEQKKSVETKQKEIIDSIYYAKRIQQALLPSEKYIKKNIK